MPEEMLETSMNEISRGRQRHTCERSTCACNQTVRVVQVLN